MHVEEILHFKEDLSVLLISILFIRLASRIDINIIARYGWPILLLLVIAQFIIRPQAQTTDIDKPTDSVVDAIEKKSEEGSNIRTYNGIDDNGLPLFALDKERRLYVYGADEKIALKIEGMLIVLSP